MSDSKIGVVCYTDGSARPNPGNAGWGAHGYIYKIEDVTKNTTVSNHIVTNKGYLQPNYLEDAVPVKPTHYFDFFGSSLEEGTNNSSELSALYNSLLKLSEYNPERIHILTDSEYVKNGITEWCKNWERLNWHKHDGTVPANVEVWKKTYNYLKDLKAKGVQFNIEWVKAHNEVLGNTEADILSVIAMNYSYLKISRFEYTVTEAKSYNTEIEKHPFLNYNRIYFNSVSAYNVPGQYYQADPGHGVSDFVIGKRHSSAGYSIIRLNEPIRVIEDIKQRQFDVAVDINGIMMIKVDKVFHKNTYSYLRDYGGYCLLPLKNTIDLAFIGKEPISVENNPTGLSMRAIDNFNILDEILSNYVDYSNNDQTKLPYEMSFHDITSTFYTKTVNKKDNVVVELNDNVNSLLKFINVNISIKHDNINKTIPTPLVLGIDILPRNNLKKIETENPLIYIVTWQESPDVLKYATIIKCDSGVGIWSNYFADKIFLKNFVS